MKEQIFNFIKKRCDVSFVELSRNIEGFNGGVRYETLENLVLWDGMSEEAANSIHELLKEKRIIAITADRFVYFIDGGSLKYSVAKKEMSYKKPHWLPIVFRVA